MKCPYCQQEMKKGYIQSNHQIYYTDKKQTFSFHPKKEDLHLSEFVLEVPAVSAWHCKVCRKIIIDY